VVNTHSAPSRERARWLWRYHYSGIRFWTAGNPVWAPVISLRP
jgi:hypothetical protein